MPRNQKDEVTARAMGWKHYEFRYRTHEDKIESRRVYAANDETAAFLFNKVYAKDVKEMLKP